MALTDLSSTQLKRLITLVKEKEDLQAKLEQVNHALTGLVEGRSTVAPALPKTRKGSGRRQRRGKLKDGILKLLTTAGKSGLTVKELAENLKAKPASVSVWFYTTGKKIKGIAKVGPNKYAYSA